MSFDKSKQRNYTDAELRSLDRKLLTAVSQHNGIATRVSPALRSLIEKKPVLPGDTLRAHYILESSDYKSSVHIRPDNHINTHGGHQESSPAVIKYKDLTGKESTRDNLPIPLPFGVEVRYDNIQAVAAFCAQIVKNDVGTWHSAVNSASWEKVYATGVNPAGIQLVANLVCEMLTRDPYWGALTPQARNSVQGPEMLSFIAISLNRTSELDYYALNCNIVIHALTVMVQRETLRGTRWIALKGEDGKPLVPNSCWESIAPNDNTRPLLQDFPAIFKYKGSLPLLVRFPTKTGTLKAAVTSLQLLREVQGGDNACSALLSAMRGYTGLTDEFGRRIQFLISSALACWSRGKPVTIQLSSIGDLYILVSSLNHWRRHIVQLLSPSSSGSEKLIGYKFSEETMVVKYIVPGFADKQKLNHKFMDDVVLQPFPESVFIMYNPGNLPTASEKGAAVDYESGSRGLIPEMTYGNDFIIYTVIYGDYPFPKDSQVLRARSSMTARFYPIQRKDANGKIDSLPLYVYRHGTASGFRGIISTFGDLWLMGYGPKPVVGSVEDGYPVTGHDFTDKGLHRIFLPKVILQAQWYDRVVLDCEAQSVIFGNPVIRYSGISNLVYQSKVAAMMNVTLVQLEHGVSAGMLTLRKRHVQEDEEVDFTPTSSGATSTSSSHSALVKVGKVQHTTENTLPVGSSLQEYEPLTEPIDEGQEDDEDEMVFNNYGQIDEEDNEGLIVVKPSQVAVSDL